jgi:DNA-binding NarL/FixJ family response regulator
MTASRTTKHNPTISLLSDQTLFREGVSELLNRRGYHRVAQFKQSFELLTAAAERAPDIVLVDLDHESEDTMTLMRRLRRDLPDAHLVVMGTAVRRAAADAATTSAVETPVGGGRELAAATAGDRQRQTVGLIRELRNWQGVTPRQRDVLRWLAVGLDNYAIAGKLRIGDRAVKRHITKMLDTFRLDNRTQLALLAYRAGLRPPATRERRSRQQDASVSLA